MSTPTPPPPNPAEGEDWAPEISDDQIADLVAHPEEDVASFLAEIASGTEVDTTPWEHPLDFEDEELLDGLGAPVSSDSEGELDSGVELPAEAIAQLLDIDQRDRDDSAAGEVDLDDFDAALDAVRAAPASGAPTVHGSAAGFNPQEFDSGFDADDLPPLPVSEDVGADVGEEVYSPGAAFQAWRRERRVDLRPRVEELEAQLAASTNELHRTLAEFANYRKRLARDRDIERDRAVGEVFIGLLSVFDNLARAREHGDLTGPPAAIADSLVAACSRMGLERFGEKGDLFDPTLHEAVQHSVSVEVEETSCVEVYQAGYRFAGKILRPARVHVADPAVFDDGPDDPPAGASSESTLNPPHSSDQF